VDAATRSEPHQLTRAGGDRKNVLDCYDKRAVSGAAPCRREGPAAAAGRAVDVLVLHGAHDTGLAPVDLLRRRDVAVAVLLNARYLVCPEDERQARIRVPTRWPQQSQQSTCAQRPPDQRECPLGVYF